MVVGVDFSQTCITDAVERYKGMQNPGKVDLLFLNVENAFSRGSLEAVTGALRKHGIIGEREEAKFDMVVCHLAFHYSFETEESAREAMEVVRRSLRPNGVFIGTISNGDRICHWYEDATRDADRKGMSGDQRAVPKHTIVMKRYNRVDDNMASSATYSFPERWGDSPYGRAVDVDICEKFGLPSDKEKEETLDKSLAERKCWQLKAREWVVPRAELIRLAGKFGMVPFRGTTSGVNPLWFDIEVYWTKMELKMDLKWLVGGWEFFSSYAVFSFVLSE